MNFLKKCLVLKIAACSMLVADAQAKNVPYAEDAYFAQAPQELLDAAQKAAILTQFEGDYEVRIPKKASLQVSPFYAFTAKSVNLQTNTPVIIVNPMWFNVLPQNEQDFLLARYFVIFKMGVMPTSATILLILYGFLSLLLFALSFWILRKTRLVSQRLWVRILIALGIVIAAEFAIFDRVHKQLEQHLSMQHEIAIVQKTIEYTGNKEAAIRALEFVDSSIKAVIKNGEAAWTPYEHVFANLANELKK